MSNSQELILWRIFQFQLCHNLPKYPVFYFNILIWIWMTIWIETPNRFWDEDWFCGMKMNVLPLLLLLLKLKHTDINMLAAELPSSLSCNLPGLFPDGLWSVHNPFSAALFPPPFSPGLWQDKSDKRKKEHIKVIGPALKQRESTKCNFTEVPQPFACARSPPCGWTGISQFAAWQQLRERKRTHLI